MYNEYYRRKTMIEDCVNDMIQTKGAAAAQQWLVETLATTTQDLWSRKRTVIELKRLVKWWKMRSVKRSEHEKV